MSILPAETRRPLLAALAFLALSVSPAMAQDSASLGPRTLTVTAEGEASAPPDLAHIGVSVSTQAGEAGAALDEMSAALDGVLATLAGLGIAPEDIQTEGLFLEETFDYSVEGNPKPTGFTASSTLGVTVREIDRVGEVLDVVVDGGANRLGGISFGFADPEDVMDGARQAAVAEAVRQAEVLAAAAGVDLGDLVSLRTGGDTGGAPIYAVEQMARDVPVATGTVALTATVTLTWQIAE